MGKMGHRYSSFVSVLLLAAQALAGLSAAGIENGNPLDVSSREPQPKVPDYVIKHAPLLWLHPEDPFRPSDLLAHVRHTTPMSAHKPIPDVPDLNLDNLAVLNTAKGGPGALASKDNVTEIPSWLLGEMPDEKGILHNSTACVVLLIEKSPEITDVFYWYFYSYNRGANITWVVEPFNRIFGAHPPSFHFGDHVGDWEHNMIRFKNGEPTGLFYSQHDGGASFDWNDHTVSKKDEIRPFVYSAYGSHANYVTEGEHIHNIVLIDWCKAGHLWDPVESAFFYRYDPKSSTFTSLQRDGSKNPALARADSFIYYKGLWGDEKYPDASPDQATVPYFGLKRFVPGPTGPVMKALIRNGLGPNGGAKRSWPEYIVGVFMFWYPCCIRGWRKYVSLMMFALCLMLVGFGGYRFVVKKRLQKQKYSKLETDIPLEELERENASR
ncbi:unnamed protein product [Clonostachys rosea f. rosea IK726]|uniref:Vacuolar protein sorting-associated protein 62 n=2 Tax=Bionectria ochroleuca TaxID=29856 RepID=A0A0B7KPF4_BIOOC|nr:unnamed protein product [Clonostachys rosea f. rosea IK726]